jgi:hypothetical protein
VNALASGKSPAAKKTSRTHLTSGPPQTGAGRSRGATQGGPRERAETKAFEWGEGPNDTKRENEGVIDSSE